MDQLDGSPADTDDRAGYLWIPWDSRAGVLSLACGAPMPCGAGSSTATLTVLLYDWPTRPRSLGGPLGLAQMHQILVFYEMEQF